MKKKIGIITYFYFYNYGTVLQAYALQRAINLLNKNVSAEIINYIFGEKTIRSKKQILKIRIRRLFYYVFDLRRILIKCLYKSKVNQRCGYFKQFIDTHISLSSQKYIYYNDLVKDPPIYDLYITGSDQTWSPKIGFNPALFLDFVNPLATRAAYAPSLGVNSLSDDEKKYLQDKLTGYRYLSCRETMGANLLAKIVQRNVEIVLDPTLLLKSDDWDSIKKNIEISAPYILCYFLGDRQYYRKFVRQLSKQTGLNIYYIPVSYIDFTSKNNLLWNVGPQEFIGLISKAEFICTDSFHGTAFSCNLGKQFYSFIKHEGELSGGDNSRLYDFLNRMNLLARLITNYSGGEIDIQKIDYHLTNKLLDKEREQSLNFLHKIINED